VSRVPRMTLSFALTVGLCFFVCVGGRSETAPGPEDLPRKTLVVFAASSLTNVFDELAREFESSHPGLRVLTSYASSSTLAAQIGEGEIADVFASANSKQMMKLVDAGLVACGSPAVFASNRLVVVTPADNPAGIRSFEDLGRLALALVLAAPGIPARDYADEMAAKIAADGVYGADFGVRFYDNLVSEEGSVRQVASKVALGEADAGIVYVTDLTPDISKLVRSFEIPDRFNAVAAYPIAVLKRAAEKESAEAFVEFVLGAKAKKILAGHGFGEPVGGR
jgi:molybdate transport system substrate-binding protein